MVNLKRRVFLAFYSTTYVTTLQKAYNFWSRNTMVSLKVV